MSSRMRGFIKESVKSWAESPDIKGLSPDIKGLLKRYLAFLLVYSYTPPNN